VFPVAPVIDKAGTFVTWEGRPRPFDAVFTNPASLPDLRILAGIADELAALGAGTPLGFRTVADARAQMAEMGPWDGDRPVLDTPAPGPAGATAAERPADAGPTEGLRLATWKQMIDNAALLDGEDHLRATARIPVARVPRAVYDQVGDLMTVIGDRGRATLPTVINRELPDDVVWVPANSFGRGVLAGLASPGSRVRVTGGHA
jgi:NADH-quinone oxidoreductase subunit G